MRVSPQVTLPPSGPDSILNTSPPGAVYLAGTNGLQVTLAVSAGTATVTPYYWDGTSWVPHKGDANLGVEEVEADAATVPIAHLFFRRPAEPRHYALLLTGAGTVTYADLAEAAL